MSKYDKIFKIMELLETKERKQYQLQFLDKLTEQEITTLLFAINSKLKGE